MSFLGIGLPAFTELAGGLLGGALNSAYQRNQMKAQVQAMKDIWSYQQQNAHQFEVDDLRKAGLNPILSATNSQIASMPGVSTPTSAPYSGLGNGLGNAITSGLKLDLEKKKLELDKARLENETLRNKADIGKIEAETVTEAWKSHEISSKVQLMQRELFEKVDLYDIRKKMLEGQSEQAWAMIDKLGAETYRLGTLSGLDQAETNLKVKEYKFGAFLGKYLPMEYTEDFLKDPALAFKKWWSKIGEVKEEHSDEWPAGMNTILNEIKEMYNLSD